MFSEHPELFEKNYTATPDQYVTELTLKQDLPVSLVDESGAVTGKTTIPAGTKATYLRTDNETWADLLLPDGSIGRIEVTIDEEEYTRYINGITLEDLFEDTIFAG